MTDLMLTEDEFKQSFPKGLKKGVSQEVMDSINDMLAKGQEGEVFHENLISHTHILLEGKFSLDQYVNAVKYVSYRILNNTQRRSFELTFPDKVTKWLSDGIDDKTIGSYVTAFNKSLMVTKVTAASLVPFFVMNQGYRQEALLKEVKLMRGAKSEMVQHLAASKVIDALAPPESTQPELDLKLKDSQATVDLKSEMAQLAKAQREYIIAGGSLKTVAETPIHSIVEDGDFEEVDD